MVSSTSPTGCSGCEGLGQFGAGRLRSQISRLREGLAMQTVLRCGLCTRLDLGGAKSPLGFYRS